MVTYFTGLGNGLHPFLYFIKQLTVSSIETWMSSHSAGGSRRNTSSCPLCKKPISKKDISGPLFFSTNESVEPEPPTSVQDKLKIEELEESKKQLLTHLNEMAHSLVLTNEKLSQAQTEIRQQETVKEKYQSTVRYLKQLKRYVSFLICAQSTFGLFVSLIELLISMTIYLNLQHKLILVHFLDYLDLNWLLLLVD